MKNWKPPVGQEAAVISKRVKGKWKWVEGGWIHRPPKMGENVIIINAKKLNQYVATDVIKKLVTIKEIHHAIEIVFQDSEFLWKLTLPLQGNDIKQLKKDLK